jgi:hypothetical protein
MYFKSGLILLLTAGVLALVSCKEDTQRCCTFDFGPQGGLSEICESYPTNDSVPFWTFFVPAGSTWEDFEQAAINTGGSCGDD